MGNTRKGYWRMADSFILHRKSPKQRPQHRGQVIFGSCHIECYIPHGATQIHLDARVQHDALPSLPTSCPHPTDPRSGRLYVVTTLRCRFLSKCPNHQTAGRAPVRALLVEQGCCPYSPPSRWCRTTKDLLKAKRVRPDHVACGWPHPFVRR